jgi:hypothetical protein
MAAQNPWLKYNHLSDKLEIPARTVIKPFIMTVEKINNVVLEELK